jgi:hypothetical protein
MTIMRAVGPVVAVTLVLALASCAERGRTAAPGASATPSSPAATEGLVLRVEHVGGFVPPSALPARLPIVSVYADGKAISEGPVAEIYPGPALPNLQVAQLEPGAVQDLVDRALAAGVAETTDLGSPRVADAATTRFTVVTTAGTHVREAYALWEMPEDTGVTAEQVEARARLSGLLEGLTDVAVSGGDTAAYVPEAVAAVVSPWFDPGDGLPQPEQPWPGPALPGEPLGGPPGVTCVTAGGEEGAALLDAARSANLTTPWVTGDGLRWSVAFRPLLPDETGCADLTD